MDREKKLYEAAIQGNVSTLEALIQEDPLTLDRIHVSFFLDTPLHVAVLRGHVEFVRAVLSQKPELATESDSLGHSPLHVASAKGYVEIVSELVRVSPGGCLARSKDGMIPLHLAVMKGDRVEVVKELTRACPESTRLRLESGESVYHLCVKYGNLETLQVLMEMEEVLVSGSDGGDHLLNVRDDEGNTILHLAAYHKILEIIQYLLSRPGIELNAMNNRGCTPLNLVENSPRDLKGLEVINFLLQSNAQRGNELQSFASTKTNPTSIATREENPRPRTRSRSKSWKKFFTFNGDITKQLEQMRGALFVTSAIVVAINVLPVFFIEIHEPGSSSNDLVGDFSMSTLSLWSALIIMTLLLSGFPLSNELCAWFVVQFTYTMLAFLGLYFISNIISNENHYVNVNGPAILIFIWFLMLIVVTLLNLVRIVAWLVKIIKGRAKRRKMNAIEENALLKA